MAEGNGAGATAVVPVEAEAAATAPTAVAAEALAAAAAYARHALAPETRRAYAADWAHFADWCRAAGCVPLPAECAAVPPADRPAPAPSRLGQLQQLEEGLRIEELHDCLGVETGSGVLFQPVRLPLGKDAA